MFAEGRIQSLLLQMYRLRLLTQKTPDSTEKSPVDGEWAVVINGIYFTNGSTRALNISVRVPSKGNSLKPPKDDYLGDKVDSNSKSTSIINFNRRQRLHRRKWNLSVYLSKWNLRNSRNNDRVFNAGLNKTNTCALWSRSKFDGGYTHTGTFSETKCLFQ